MGEHLDSSNAASPDKLAVGACISSSSSADDDEEEEEDDDDEEDDGEEEVEVGASEEVVQTRLAETSLQSAETDTPFMVGTPSWGSGWWWVWETEADEYTVVQWCWSVVSSPPLCTPHSPLLEGEMQAASMVVMVMSRLRGSGPAITGGGSCWRVVVPLVKGGPVPEFELEQVGLADVVLAGFGAVHGVGRVSSNTGISSSLKVSERVESTMFSIPEWGQQSLGWG